MNIIYDSVVDGEGLWIVVFFVGCLYCCVGCYNLKLWNICNGMEMIVEEIVKEIVSNLLIDVIFLGGDLFF